MWCALDVCRYVCLPCWGISITSTSLVLRNSGNYFSRFLKKKSVEHRSYIRGIMLDGTHPTQREKCVHKPLAIVFFFLSSSESSIYLSHIRNGFFEKNGRGHTLGMPKYLGFKVGFNWTSLMPHVSLKNVWTGEATAVERLTCGPGFARGAKIEMLFKCRQAVCLCTPWFSGFISSSLRNGPLHQSITMVLYAWLAFEFRCRIDIPCICIAK